MELDDDKKKIIESKKAIVRAFLNGAKDIVDNRYLSKLPRTDYEDSLDNWNQFLQEKRIWEFDDDEDNIYSNNWIQTLTSQYFFALMRHQHQSLQSSCIYSGLNDQQLPLLEFYFFLLEEQETALLILGGGLKSPPAVCFLIVTPTRTGRLLGLL